MFQLWQTNNQYIGRLQCVKRKYASEYNKDNDLPKRKLFTICDLNANETTEDEITETVLNLDTVKVCFDTQTRRHWKN